MSFSVPGTHSLNRPGFAGGSIIYEDQAIWKRKRFPVQVRERAVRFVVGSEREYASPWAAVTSIASKIDCSLQTLLNWVRQARARHLRSAQGVCCCRKFALFRSNEKVAAQ